MIKSDHMTLVKMLPMIMDKINVWQKPTLYEHPNCNCGLNIVWIFEFLIFVCFVK